MILNDVNTHIVVVKYLKELSPNALLTQLSFRLKFDLK